MNKKLLLGLFAAVGMLFATSCSQDEPTADTAVRFSLKAPAATTPFGDGTGANYLVWAVYDNAGNELTTLSGAKDAFASGLTETVSLQLTKGQTYTVAFWAQNKECGAYDYTDLENIQIVDYATVVANNEARDAFYGAVKVTVTGDFTEAVELKRPFAQLNFAVPTTEWDAAATAGITLSQSSVTVSDVAAGFNALTGSVTGTSTAATFALAALPTSDILIDVDGDGTEETYKHLSMNYILANDVTEGGKNSALADVEFTFTTNAADIVIASPATPLQRNWRTNVIGSLTNTAEFTVVLDPDFDGGYDWTLEGIEHIADGVIKKDGKYHLLAKAGLDWLNQEVTAGNTFAGKTVVLMADIDMADAGNWTGIGGSFNGTFDGQGHTIKNMSALNAYNYGNGFFTNVVSGTIKNITFDNATVSKQNPPAYGGNVYGIVAGYAYGTVTFENVHVTNSLIAAFGKVGGILGMAADPGTSVTTFKDCSVTNTTIAGVYNTGALAGLTLNVVAISGCTVEGIKWLNPTVAQGYEYVTLNTTRQDDANIKIDGKYWDGKNGWYYATNALYYNEFFYAVDAYTEEGLGIDGRPHNTID